MLAVCTLSATTITLLVCSRNHLEPASWVFGDTTNSTGWKSDGFAFVLSISNAVYAFLGSDAGAHLCEEIPNPGRNVPKVIIAFPFACACIASITDINAVLTTATGLPLVEIYYQGTGGSRVGASILMALFAFCFFGCLVGNGMLLS
jgi:choline transport protein